jgi:phosphoglycolate/pyridoxal phosphate phosphatase family enzyme
MDGLVCDLDGVVYRGEEPIPGAPEALARLRRAGVRVVFCTNNSTRTPEQYAEKLTRLGVAARPDEILTSAVVTAEVLRQRGFTGRRALVVGGEGLRRALDGIGVAHADGSGAVDVVVVGLDRSFDYELMRRAAAALHAGAAFIASNDDATFPAPGGEMWPGAGAILASLQVASGRRAEVMGKPHTPMMDAAERRLSGSRDIVIVGDRPETDLRGGAAKGWRTVLVLSGVTSRADARSVEPAPDAVIESLAEL